MRALAGLALVIGGTGLAAAQTAQPEGYEWGYNKGVFWRGPQFEVKLSTRTQFRYTYTMQDEDSLTADNGYFNIPRARLRLDGFAWFPWLKYKIQYDFTGNGDLCPSGGSGCDPTLRRPDLRDLYFDVTRAPWASVRFGQFKAPFGQQELTSSGNQEFVDRSIASERFAPSRQQGVMLYGASFKRAFGYEGGLFNGNARNKNANDNPGYMYVLRVHLDHNYEEMDKLSEAAIDNPQKVKWTVGAAYMNNTLERDLTLDAQTLSQETAEGFFALKYKRLFVLADYYIRNEEQALSTAPDVESDGYIGQVGLFLVPSKIEVALRYSEVDPNQDAENDTETEARIGFGWYFSAHDLKFQADYGQLESESKAPVDDTFEVFRAQVQIVF
jgi:phosphate-selective porin